MTSWLISWKFVACDEFCRFHHSLESLAAVCGATSIPYSDAPSQDALYGTTVRNWWGFLGLVQTTSASTGIQPQSTLDSQHSTLITQLWQSTLNTRLSTLNSDSLPSTLNTLDFTLNSQHSTLDSLPSTIYTLTSILSFDTWLSTVKSQHYTILSIFNTRHYTRF